MSREKKDTGFGEVTFEEVQAFRNSSEESQFHLLRACRAHLSQLQELGQFWRSCSVVVAVVIALGAITAAIDPGTESTIGLWVFGFAMASAIVISVASLSDHLTRSPLITALRSRIAAYEDVLHAPAIQRKPTGWLSRLSARLR
ncbi:hypothetical protein [Arthrobacter roseus]|uniref:hypothetical protein n=1 Tax=Arthrobacter roseus TaxID=136274 RepID=UPI0019668DB3|nr:hypothetical protein [Arthrobacter roseus]MBM7848803.1 hypothetical protein [Arthrobacter roseus]